MAGRRRLLWVTPSPPCRGVSAAQERFWQLLVRLGQRHDISLVTVSGLDEVPPVALPPGMADVTWIPRTLAAPDDPLALLPPVVRYWYTIPALRDAVATRLASERFDLVQYEFIELAPLIPPASIPSLLTVHQLGFAAVRASWRAEGMRPARAPLMLYQYLRELDFALRAVQRTHHVVTLSGEDARRLCGFLPALRVSVNPLGVDLEHFAPQAAAPELAVDVLFVGHFGHAPNIDAVRFLVHDVLPRLTPPARLRILGRGVTPEVQALARAGQVEVAGAVEDQRPHLAAAAVVVAPVRFGTGMRGKILEALAMGRPVVTTPLGAEGLDAIDGEHLLLARDASEFARAIDLLRRDPARAARLGAAGRRLVGARFGWDAVAAAHDRIYDEACAAPGPPPAPAWSGGALAQRSRAIRIPAGIALLAARALAWHWKHRPC